VLERFPFTGRGRSLLDKDKKKYYAHSLPGHPPEKWQLLETHLANVAKLASEFASKFNSADWGWNAGWLHDIGKAADEFQAYILRVNGLDDAEYDAAGNGRVNHSSAGAAWAEERMRPMIGRVLAYLAAGHHAGLPDYHPSDTGNAALQIRLGEGKQNLALLGAEVDDFTQELKCVTKPPGFVKQENFHHWIRMLFSCLVDADFLDTEGFMNNERGNLRSSFAPLSDLQFKFATHMETLQQTPPTPVNIIRREVLAACRTSALSKPGLYSLTVPTGGGKTLSSMAFALDHALKYCKKRIIYVIPYTSIIEQNARVFSDIFSPENVIEHHSNLDVEKESLRSQLASENWDAPIIVTTNVQFFESLYACKNSRCRKLHNLIDSVIILDEAQLLPPKWLDPCVDILNQLSRHFGVTVVLATATQPALPGLDQSIELISDPADLYKRLIRTEIKMPDDFSRPRSWENLAEEIKQFEQVLCVVNTRRDCYDLFKLMPKNTIHLSALMCGQHRSKVIQAIKERLRRGMPIRVISTQLVEAGVDIDFPVVYRALAGLDSIAQASGRCNREGRLSEIGKLGQVVVFIPPKPAPRGILLKGESTTRELATISGFNPQNPEEYTRFFQLFYSKLNDTGAQWLKDRLVRDVKAIHFRTAGKEFKLIDDQTQQSVLINYPGNEETLKRLRQEGPSRLISRKLQRFSVNLSQKVFLKAKTDGLVEEIYPGFWLWIGKYDERYGVDIFGSGWAVEDLIK
jgi:CRISPR-associated endonuclease/helicase Cas3